MSELYQLSAIQRSFVWCSGMNNHELFDQYFELMWQQTLCQVEGDEVVHLIWGSRGVQDVDFISHSGVQFREFMTTDVQVVVMCFAVKFGELGLIVDPFVAEHGFDGLILLPITIEEGLPRGREELSRALFEAYPDYVFRLVASPDRVTVGGACWLLMRRRRRRVWLLLDRSVHGKTSGAIGLSMAAGISVCHGDGLLQQIALGKIRCTPQLYRIAKAGYDSDDWSISIRELFNDNVYHEFFDIGLNLYSDGDLIWDMWVPIERRPDVVSWFKGIPDVFPFHPGHDAALEVRELTRVANDSNQRMLSMERELSRASSAHDQYVMRQELEIGRLRRIEEEYTRYKSTKLWRLNALMVRIVTMLRCKWR